MPTTDKGDKNKIKYGIKNVTLFPATDDGEKLTYGEAVPWPGASELSLDPNGDAFDGYYDDIDYVHADNNQGYTGKLTMAYFQAKIEALLTGAKLDDNGGILENVDNQGSPVAMAFEFSGDKNKVRHILYNVSFTRPSDGSTSKSDKLEAQNTELNLTAKPDPYTGNVKYKQPADGSDYANWFTKVVVPGTDTDTSTPDPAASQTSDDPDAGSEA